MRASEMERDRRAMYNGPPHPMFTAFIEGRRAVAGKRRGEKKTGAQRRGGEQQGEAEREIKGRE